jgi:hypothetical protein
MLDTRYRSLSYQSLATLPATNLAAAWGWRDCQKE